MPETLCRHTGLFFFLYGYINIPPSVLLTLRHLCVSCLPLSPLSTHLLPIFSSPPLLPSYLSPCAPPYLERDLIFFFFKERGDGKGGEGLKWEGCLFIRAASSRLHVATKTTARPAEGNVQASGHRSLHPRDTPSDRPPARHNRRPQLPSPRPQTQVRERYMA